MEILGVKAETWFPVVTLVIGVAMKGLFDFISDKRRLASEKEARSEARQDMLTVRATEFQRETLLNLQESTQVLMRASGRSHHEDRMALSEGFGWGKRPISVEADNMSLDGQVRLTRYRVRVEDDAIRELASAFSKATAERVTAQNEKEAEAALNRAVQAFTEMNEKIGIALRART